MFRNKLSIVLIAVCVALLLADLGYDKHAKYPIEGRFGSYALAGFLGSVALVLIARVLGLALGREDDYYDR